MKKFSKKLIPYFFVINIVYAAFLFFFLNSSFADENGKVTEEFTKIALLIAVIGYVVLLIYSILYYNKSGYELKEKEIYCTRGVLFKKQSILEYSKIHAINKKQGLIQRIFGLCTITIDSGSTNTAHQSEIIIIEDFESVDLLMSEIKAKQNNETTENTTIEENIEKENLYNFNAKTKFIYTALNCLGAFITVLIISLFVGILFTYVFPNVDFGDEEFEHFDFVLLIVGILGLTLAISLFASVMVSFIQYHDFKIYRTHDSIEINYGLFTKHQNSFKLNRVKGIRINQGIIKRIFKFATINLEVIGYSNTTTNNNEQAQSIGVLIPLCKYNEINFYLDKILPNYKPEPKDYKTIKFLPFISYFLIFGAISFGLALVCTIIPLIYFGLWTETLYISIGIILTFIIFILIVCLNQLFAYQNNGICINDNKVTIYRGGLNKEIAVVLKNNIIGIEKITTHHRNKEGINSYLIHFKSNAMTNTIKVNNISIDTYEELLNLMTY